MKNIYYILLSLTVFTLGYIIIAAITFGILHTTIPAQDTVNPILKLKPLLTMATWTGFIAPLSLFITYPLSFKLGRYLIAKKAWELDNITKLLTVTLAIYITPTLLLLLFHILPH